MSCSLQILVTGGGGYIGSHVVVELLTNGYKVIVVDNLVNCYTKNVNEKPVSLKRVEEITGKNVTFYKLDLRDERSLIDVFQKHVIDCVIHFAALKAVGESVEQPIDYYANNVGGSVTLLQVMKMFKTKRIVYSSSATVYGNPQLLPISEEHPVGQNITNPYGKSKYFVEEILKDLCNSDLEWCAISLRYFNPVGAHESGKIGEDPSGIPNNLMPYISQVATGKREFLSIYGNDYCTKDGTGVRDYIHITDLAIGHIKALLKIMECPYKGWKVYNLGTGQGYSVLEIVAAFGRASGKNVSYKIVERRKGDVASSYADASLAKVELGWIAERGIDEMCKDTWNWQKNNPNGYQGCE